MPAPVETHPRRPWLALLLGIFLPTIGFAYVGRLGLYVLLFVGVFGSIAVLGRVGLLQTLPGIWGMVSVTVALAIACALLPWWFARRQHLYRLRWYNRWYVYPLLVVALHVPVLMLLLQREAWLGYGSYRIPSTSMAPTVDAGDFIAADSRPSTLASLHVGDVVIVESESTPGQLLLRRIVAMGGQHVEIDQDGVRVGGVLQSRAHLQGDDVVPRMAFADVELAPDELFLMGDNRGNSWDSRFTGPASRSTIHAKATVIWWSRRLSRLGSIPTP